MPTLNVKAAQMVDLTKANLNSLRYLAKTGPCWKMVPRYADGELERFIKLGLVAWQEHRGYSITSAGLHLVHDTRNYCPHCGSTLSKDRIDG